MAGTFSGIISILFDLVLLVFLLRLLLELFKVDLYNPLSVFANKVTAPILSHLSKLIPRYRNFNLACLSALLLIQLFKLMLTSLLFVGTLPNVMAWLPASFLQLVAFVLNFYFFAILIRIITSWVSPYNYNPIISALYQITEPLMLPGRRLIKPIAGLDFSPIIVILAIQILERLTSYFAARVLLF